jgi:hypothetical protein
MLSDLDIKMAQVVQVQDQVQDQDQVQMLDQNLLDLKKSMSLNNKNNPNIVYRIEHSDMCLPVYQGYGTMMNNFDKKNPEFQINKECKYFYSYYDQNDRLQDNSDHKEDLLSFFKQFSDEQLSKISNISADDFKRIINDDNKIKVYGRKLPEILSEQQQNVSRPEQQQNISRPEHRPRPNYKKNSSRYKKGSKKHQGSRHGPKQHQQHQQQQFDTFKDYNSDFPELN